MSESENKMKESKAPYPEIATEMIGQYKMSVTNSDIYLQSDVVDIMFTPFIRVMAKELTFLATSAGATRRDRRNAVYTKYDILGSSGDSTSKIHEVILRNRKEFWKSSKIMFLDLSCHGNEVKVWDYLKGKGYHKHINEVNIDKITEAVVLRDDKFLLNDEERAEVVDWIRKNICYFNKEARKGIREDIVGFFDIFLGQYNFDPLNECKDPKDKYILMGATPPENLRVMSYEEYRTWNEDAIARDWDDEVEAYLEEQKLKEKEKAK